MGCPGIYYTRMLQKLCHALNFDADIKRSRMLHEETDNRILEDEINKFRKTMNPIRFAFDAGRAAELVSIESEGEGGDTLNACIGGFVEFESFICGDDET